MTGADTVVKTLEAALTEDFASIPELAGTRVLASERELDDVQKLTILIRRAGIERHATAPLAKRDYKVLLTVIAPALNLNVAGEQLDDAVDALLDYLDRHYRHGDAEVVMYAKRLAYDIPTTLTVDRT